MKKILVLSLLGLFLIIPANSAEIKITIPDHRLGDIQNTFASTYNYQTTINGEPNPETKEEFMHRMIKVYIKNVYVSHHVTPIQATRQSLINTANSNFTGITVLPVE